MINQEALNTIFLEARTHSVWQNKEVSDSLLQKLFDLMIKCPTSANMLPARITFVKSKEAKEKLKPTLMEGNVEKTLSAPVTAIIGYDLRFYDYLPKLFPFTDARSWFVGNEDFAKEAAFRNSSIQGGYFILAARSLGLDCGPMSGFDNAKVDQAFFPDGRIKSNFLCNLGYGYASKLHPRAPRLEFSEVCKIV
jgi:3-hydroxypropanoate dehydrogenase